MQIEWYRALVALYQAQAATGQDAELRQFAADTLVTLESQLHRLTRMQRNLALGNVRR